MSKSTDERYEEAQKERREFYNKGGAGTSNPATFGEISRNILAGMIPLSEMEDGAYYLGWCRNAVVAKWQKDKGCFIHWRTKFSSVFTEEINHPEDDDGYDVFTPLKEIEPTEAELIDEN
jgi:hypothetical protein